MSLREEELRGRRLDRRQVAGPRRGGRESLFNATAAVRKMEQRGDGGGVAAQHWDVPRPGLDPEWLRGHLPWHLLGHN